MEVFPTPCKNKGVVYTPIGVRPSTPANTLIYLHLQPGGAGEGVVHFCGMFYNFVNIIVFTITCTYATYFISEAFL